LPLIASYEYTDRSGNVLFTKNRYEPGKNGKKKDFNIEGLTDDTERILYNIVDVSKSETVIICDGEKDVETLRGLGYVATTMPNGCGSSWLKSYSSDLSGKDIILMLDQDHKLEDVTKKVKDGLAGYAKSIRVVNVTGVKDVTDYIEAGNTKDDLDALIQFSQVEDNRPAKKARIENKQLREPSAKHSEELVLGAVMNGQATFEDIEELTESDFYHQANRIIFNSIKTLWSEVGVGDIKAVAQWLEDRKQIEAVGGLTYLLDLTSDLPKVFSVESHVESIRGKTASRLLLDSLESAADRLVLGEAVDKVQSDILDKASKVQVAGRSDNTSSCKELVGDIDNLLKPREYGIACDPLSVVWDQFYGLQPGALMTIGARSGVGKTSMLGQVLSYAAVKYSVPTLLLTFEVPKADALLKMICQVSKVSYLDAIRGNINEEQRDKLRKVSASFSKSNFRIDDRNSYSIAKLRSYLKFRKSSGDPLKLLAVDYIQIASMTGGGDRRDLDLGKLTRGFKGLCLEFSISCIILSQLNRQGDREGGRDPQIGDLRDSQSMEADSDIILLLNQNLMKDSDDPEYRDASISLVKNRCGGTGKFDCRFHKSTASFTF